MPSPEGFSPPEWLTQGLITEVLGWIVTGILAFGLAQIIRGLSRHTKVGIPVKLLMVAIFCVSGLFIAALFQLWSLVIAIAVSGVALAWFALRGLFRIGLIDAFARTSSGISASSSLKMAHDSIAFLGIGASKLTSDTEFEGAIRRCSSGGSGGTCRFLLSSPDNQLLEKLAHQNGATSDQYKDTVRSSLKTLANMKINKSLNVEVRFHPTTNRADFQQFRLMIINNKTCLMSWTVWDDTVGLNNPQMILRQSSSPGLKVTLFKAFNDYFEEMWHIGDPVDLQDYL